MSYAMSTESSKASNVSTKAKATPNVDASVESNGETSAGQLPGARVVREGQQALDEPAAAPLLSWRRVAALTAIVIGWAFIAWRNHFYLTPAVVILALGWAASISTLYFLWRVGAAGGEAGVAREDWWLAIGQQEELMREKRALLKTIREIEFDQQTGKLSPHDAQEMIQVVRVRAIEVMKALDEVEQGGGARAEIEREVRVRLEIEKARKAGAAAKKAKGGGEKANASAGKPAAKAEVSGAHSSEAKNGAKSDTKTNAKSDAKAEGARSATAINAAGAAAEPTPFGAAAGEAGEVDDDEAEHELAAESDSSAAGDHVDSGDSDERGEGAPDAPRRLLLPGARALRYRHDLQVPRLLRGRRDGAGRAHLLLDGAGARADRRGDR
jgi:hypothetical protein